ncbi:MAG: EutN/CcmL family microcompartment protein [Firmicutes bacterium]|nr:EutN/CcmL family microcompartment protein [Bacillota bacterium]
MKFAQVIGTVVSVQKGSAFEGIKLMVLQPLGPDLRPAGAPYIAADGTRQAGYQDIVVVVFRGDAPMAFDHWVAVDASIVGIVDPHCVNRLRSRQKG